MYKCCQICINVENNSKINIDIFKGRCKYELYGMICPQNALKKRILLRLLKFQKVVKKYELDKETGLIILDRILYTSTHYPANYGFYHEHMQKIAIHLMS